MSGYPISKDVVIVSDDAGQFNVFLHALCWIHAERLVHKLQPLNSLNRKDIESVRGQIWDLYANLKAYKKNPSAELKAKLQEGFDAIFSNQWTSFSTLNLLLGRLNANKEELLLVLDRPEIPIHTNGSELDLRDLVKWRKISGCTRSDLGRQYRDTSASLKATSRKLGISYWDFLYDRISCRDEIPLLYHILEERLTAERERAAFGPSVPGQ